MGGTRNGATHAAVLVVVVAVLIERSRAATYTVGDSMAWNTPSNGASTYASWAAQHIFTVGDSLVFNFATGIHTAAKVTSDVFNNCNTANTIDLKTTSPATFTLNSSGPAYFVCTTHCSQGQKLSVNVTSSGSPGSPKSSPSPGIPPSGTGTSPPPPNKSSASTVVFAFPLIFISIFLTNMLV